MKKAIQLTAVLVIAVMVLTTFSGVAFAATANDENGGIVSPMVTGDFTEVYFDEFGNQYGFTGWGSLAAASSYYGSSYAYYPCSVSYGGNSYNYYYEFSDNSRMYFGVRG